MAHDPTRAAWIIAGGFVLGVILLVAGLAWVVFAAAGDVTDAVDRAATQLNTRLESLSRDVSQPIERLFHDPVPIQTVQPISVMLPVPVGVRAQEPLPVALPTPLIVSPGEYDVPVLLPDPIVVGAGDRPLSITIQAPVIVQGPARDAEAVPVETDVNLFGGGNDQ